MHIDIFCTGLFVYMVFSLIACADAYLTPCIQKYVEGFASGFKEKVCTFIYCKRCGQIKGTLLTNK